MAATEHEVLCGVPGWIKLNVPGHFKWILKDNILLLQELFPLLFRNEAELPGKEREQEKEGHGLLWFLELYNDVFTESDGFISTPNDGGDMMGKFREVYRKRFSGVLCLATSRLKKVHMLASAEAKKSAANAAGATDLEERIEREQMWIGKINDFKKKVVVCAIQTKRLEAFCEKAREAFSFDASNEVDFYSQEEQRQRESKFDEMMEVTIKDLLEEISFQNDESEMEFAKNVRSKLLGIKNQFIGTSCRSMKAAEFLMISIVDELKEMYKKKISVLLVSPLMKTSSVRNILQSARVDCVNEFEKREKPGCPEFQTGYLQMLYEEMLEACKEVLEEVHVASLAQIEVCERESRQGVETCLGKTSVAFLKACVPEYAKRMNRTVRMELDEALSDLRQNTLVNKAVVQLILDKERKSSLSSCETGCGESKPCKVESLQMTVVDCDEEIRSTSEDEDNLNEGQQMHTQHLLQTIADIQMREEINTIVMAYVKQYIDKMRDLRKANRNGLATGDLTSHHMSITSEIKKLLQTDIKKKIDNGKLIAAQRQVFLTYIDPYWEIILEENIRVRSKNKKIDELENILQEQKQNEIVWEENNTKTKKIEEIQNRPQQQMLQQKSIESKVKDHQRLSTFPNSGKSKVLPPIVFQFRPSRVVMGTMVDGNPQLLRNEWGEDFTIPVIGLRQKPFHKSLSTYNPVAPEHWLRTNNQQRHTTRDSSSDNSQYILHDNLCWIYGSEILSLQDADDHQILLKTWLIADCIIKNDTPWKEEIEVGGQKLQITFEFLLGYLLSQLKRFAELKMDGTFPTAVITVPFWLTSSQRIQVKDAGRVAGFTDVYLVNESSAAVYSCVRNCGRPSSEPILVLAETSGHVEAFVYSFDGAAKTIIMISHAGAGTQKQTERFELWHSRNHTLSPESQQRVAKVARQVCMKAMLMFKEEKGRKNTQPLSIELLVVSESPGWTQLLESVGKEFARRESGVGRMAEKVLHGAVLLSKNPQQIGKHVLDLLAFQLVRAVDMAEGRSVVQIYSTRTRLPIDSCKVPRQLPRYHVETRFYQVVRGVVIPIGELLIPAAEAGRNRSVMVILEINNEGIVTLNCITLNSFNERGIDPIPLEATSYKWKTPNLTADKLSQYSSLIAMSEYIGQQKQAELTTNSSKSVGQAESNMFENRRETLIKKIREMLQFIQIGKTRLKSDLAKGTMTSQLEKILKVAEDRNTGAGEIEEHTESLASLYSKYF